MGFLPIFLLFSSIILSIGVSFSDVPASIFMLIVIAICFGYSKIGKKSTSKERFSLFAIVTFIYLISALITSTCFSASDFFMVSDPMRYIAMASRPNSYGIISDEISHAYLGLADNNGLYNSFLRLLGIICQENSSQPTSLLLTLPQTLFGVLTIQTLFRILSLNFSAKKSIRYTLIYSICSLTLLYSGIIVRDIIIAFIFAVCIETVLKPFSIKGLMLLWLMMILCIGIRLFSGLFITVFILYYLFFNIKSQRAKALLYPIGFVVLLAILSSGFVGNLMNITNEEVDTYTKWQSGVAAEDEGFSSALRKLPSGINYIALSLYSQMNPFPPYSTLKAQGLNFVQIYMACILSISAIWWFFVSYSLMWFFFLKKAYRKLSFRYNCLYAIALLLIFVSCTMHVDIRRLIPVYPIIYLLFLYCINYYYNQISVQKTYTKLGFGYIVLNLLYLLIK